MKQAHISHDGEHTLCGAPCQMAHPPYYPPYSPVFAASPLCSSSDKDPVYRTLSVLAACCGPVTKEEFPNSGLEIRLEDTRLLESVCRMCVDMELMNLHVIESLDQANQMTAHVSIHTGFWTTSNPEVYYRDLKGRQAREEEIRNANPNKPVPSPCLTVKEIGQLLQSCVREAEDDSICHEIFKGMYFCDLPKGHKGMHSEGGLLHWGIEHAR